MGLAAYCKVCNGALTPAYEEVPEAVENRCGICNSEVEWTILLGAMWVCGPCFDEAKEQWNPGKLKEGDGK